MAPRSWKYQWHKLSEVEKRELPQQQVEGGTTCIAESSLAAVPSAGQA